MRGPRISDFNAEFAKDGIYRLLKDECEKKWKGNEEKTKECLIKYLDLSKRNPKDIIHYSN